MKLVAVFGWLLRAALVVLALQLGGVIHGVADALATFGVVHAEHEECPADGACNDCLAGCPNCHCAGSLRTVIPEGALALEPRHGEPGLALLAADASSLPLGPTLPSLYRPPRVMVRAVTIS